MVVHLSHYWLVRRQFDLAGMARELVGCGILAVGRAHQHLRHEGADAMMEEAMKEHPFTWHCPKCKATQTDTVNAALGPFISVTCGTCGAALGADELSKEDREAFESAVEKALAE